MLDTILKFMSQKALTIGHGKRKLFKLLDGLSKTKLNPSVLFDEYQLIWPVFAYASSKLS